MKERIVPGLLLAVSWLLLVLFGSASFFNLVVALVLFLAADEYVKMAAGASGGLAYRLFLDFLYLYPVVSSALFPGSNIVLVSSLISFCLLVFWHLGRFGRESLDDVEADYLQFTKDLFGLFYIGVLGSHICLVRALPEGVGWILVVTAITACSDTGAYFSGKQFGRHKLCPRISPKKTVEGAIGGMLCAVLGALFSGAFLLSSPHFLFLCGTALLLSLLGIVGDLVESIIKRGTGIKDSGRCLGGHGGILDRIDSLLFAVPALYYLLTYFQNLYN